MYFGPANLALEYFIKNKVISEPSSGSSEPLSPGDALIDILGLDPSADETKPTDNQSQFSSSQEEDTGDVPLLDSNDNDIQDEQTNKKGPVSQELLADIYLKSRQRKNLIETLKNNVSDESVVDPPKKRPGFFAETFVLFSRRFTRSKTRDTVSLFGQIVVTGLVLAIAFQGQGFTDTNIFYR